MSNLRPGLLPLRLPFPRERMPMLRTVSSRHRRSAGYRVFSLKCSFSDSQSRGLIVRRMSCTTLSSNSAPAASVDVLWPCARDGLRRPPRTTSAAAAKAWNRVRTIKPSPVYSTNWRRMTRLQNAAPFGTGLRSLSSTCSRTPLTCTFTKRFRVQFERAPAALQKLAARLHRPCLGLAGQEPGSGDVPGSRARVRQIVVADPLLAPVVADPPVFGSGRCRADRPIHIGFPAAALAFDVDRLVEDVLRHDGPAPQSVGPEGIVRQLADGDGRAQLDFSEAARQRAKRCAGHAACEGFVASLDLARARVVAVVPEDAAPVLESVLQKAAVHHQADVARGREVVRAERAVDEIVVRDAG